MVPSATAAAKRGVRELGRLAVALMGLVVAVAVITGSSAAMDAATVSLKESAASTVAVDIIGTDVTNDLMRDRDYADSKLDAMASVEGIEEVQPTVIFPSTHTLNSEGEYAPYYAGGTEAVMFLPEDSAKILDSYRIVGEMPEVGSVAIAGQMAADLGVGIGDDVALLFYVYEPTYDPSTGAWGAVSGDTTLVLEVSEIWTQEPFPEQVTYYDDGSSLQFIGTDTGSVVIRENVNPVFMNMADLIDVVSNLPYGPLRDHYYEDSVTHYLMWVDRGDLIDAGGVEDEVESLDSLQAELLDMSIEYDFTVQRSALAWALLYGAFGLEENRIYLMAICAPAIAISIYISSAAANLHAESMSDRLRFQARASSGNQGRPAFIFLEITALGLIATILGIAIGLVLSLQFRGDVVLFVTAGATAAQTSDLVIGWTTALAAMLSGVLGAIVVFLPPRLRVLGHRKPSAGIRPKRRLIRTPLFDALLVAVSLLGIAIASSGFQWGTTDDPAEYRLTADAALTAIILGLLVSTPAMLAVGTVGLLTKSRLNLHSLLAAWTAAWLSRKPAAREGRDHAFDTRRAGTIAAIVALTVALGVFTATAIDPVVAHGMEVAELTVGADVMASGDYNGYWDDTGWVPPLNLSKVDEMDGVNGVESTALVMHFLPTVKTAFGVAASVIDPQDYFDTVRPDDSYFEGGDRGLLDLLDSAGNVIVTEEFAKYANVSTGDRQTMSVHERINWTYTENVWSIEVVIAGTVTTLPGLGYFGILLGEVTLAPVPYFNFTHLCNGFSTIVDVRDGGDPETVADAVERIFTECGLDCSAVTVDDYTANEEYVGMEHILMFDYSISVACCLVGVGIFTTSDAVRRRVSYGGGQTAEHSSRRPREILVSESTAAVVIGAVVGTLAGLVGVYMLHRVWSHVDEDALPLQGQYITPGAMEWLLPSLAALVIGSALVAWLAVRRSTR